VDESQAEVDHFLPHTLLARGFLSTNLNGIWNLVLACRECNRGRNGKSARVPRWDPYLERLARRNDYLIESHHPLRETLMAQLGDTATARGQFLQTQHSAAKSLLIHDWASPDNYEGGF
jgi:hypothetical protein